jgi:hypothetical protein
MAYLFVLVVMQTNKVSYVATFQREGILIGRGIDIILLN